jgi:hypothetical protein
MSCCTNQINLEALAMLADTDLSKEAKVSEKLPEHLQAVMKKRLEQRDVEKAERAADSIIAIIDQAETVKFQQVVAIRNARASIAEAQRMLAHIDTAIDYGNESSNYLPLAGIVMPLPSLRGIKPEALVVPSDYKKMTFGSKKKK